MTDPNNLGHHASEGKEVAESQAVVSNTLSALPTSTILRQMVNPSRGGGTKPTGPIGMAGLPEKTHIGGFK